MRIVVDLPAPLSPRNPVTCLITGDRRGTWIYYRAIPERLAAIRDALTLGQWRRTELSSRP